jgi:hypothetical protein
MKKRGKKRIEKILESLEEEKEMKKEIKEEVVRLLKKAKEENEFIEIKRDVTLQFSKQFFIRVPRDLERMFNLQEGKKVSFIVRMPSNNPKQKADIKLVIE